MRIFKKIPLYIKLYKNRIVIDRIDNGKSSEALGTFSNSRILCADFEKIEKIIREIIEHLAPRKNIFANNYIAVIHQLEMNEGGLYQVEKRVLRDASDHGNILWMKILDSKNEISHTEVKRILNIN